MDMDADKTFYTATMARLLNSQGKYEEAARIYRHLLEQAPDRADIRQALEDVCANLPDLPQHWERVSDLVGQWVRLVLKQQQLLRLSQLRIKKE